MEPYDPTELIGICHSILDDDEITYNEAYDLADWLNNHQDACFQWPGNTLVEPLQRVWADGKLTKSELRQLVKLLRGVTKEWTRRESEESIERVRAAVHELATGMPPKEALLPLLDVSVRIKSSSERGLHYDVHLAGPNCTCPDWIKGRTHHPEGHLSRACKHVLAAYSQIVPSGLWRGWLGAFIDVGWRAEPTTSWRLMEVDGVLYLLSSAGAKGWANVYCELDGRYERFGYNVAEGHWAYGAEPAGSFQLARALHGAQPRF